MSNKIIESILYPLFITSIGLLHRVCYLVFNVFQQLYKATVACARLTDFVAIMRVTFVPEQDVLQCVA